MDQKRSKSRAGMTIVESLVALTLFAVFVTGACKMMVAHTEMSDLARDHYIAANIAKNRIEQARSFQTEQIDGFAENTVVVDADGFADTEGNYRRSTTISKVTDNLYEVVVIVEVRDRETLGFDGPKQELKTYFAVYLTEDSSVGGGVTPNAS